MKISSHDSGAIQRNYPIDKKAIKKTDAVNHPSSGKPETGNRITPLIDGPAIFPIAKQMIKGAGSTIQLEMYSLGDKAMIDLLSAEAKKGIKVQVIFDPNTVRNKRGNLKQTHLDTLEKFKSAGVKSVYFPASKKPMQLDHIKLLIVDGSSVLMGGMNWGSTSTVNHDADIKLEGPAVEYYRAAFNDSWQRSGGKVLDNMPPAKKVPGATGEIQGITTELKRDNSIKSAVMKNINRAQKSIHMETFVLSDNEVIDGLLDAKKRGVEVKVLLDPTGVKGGGNLNGKTFDTLKNAGIEVKWYKVDKSVNQMLHAKWGVFDEEEMIIGSANWSYKGLQINREIGADLKDEPTVSAFEKQFAYDWENRASDQLPV